MTSGPTAKEAAEDQDRLIKISVLLSILLLLLAARRRVGLLLWILPFPYPLIGLAATGSFPKSAIRLRGRARDALQELYKVEVRSLARIAVQGSTVLWETAVRNAIVRHVVLQSALGLNRNLLPSEVRELNRRVFPFQLGKLDGFRRDIETARAEGRLIGENGEPVRPRPPSGGSGSSGSSGSGDRRPTGERDREPTRPSERPPTGSRNERPTGEPEIDSNGVPVRRPGRRVSRRAIGARANLYGGAGRAEWFRGDEIDSPEGIVIDYVSMDDEGTCIPCLDAEDVGPYLPGRGPFPGVVCLGGNDCRCIRIPRQSRAEYEILIRRLSEGYESYSGDF